LSTIERQVLSDHNNARYMMRLMPYRTVDNVIGGVVITFVDITRITAAEARIDELTISLRDRLRRLETLVEMLPVGILIMEDGEHDRLRLNRHGAQLMGDLASVGDAEGLRPSSPVMRLFQGDRELDIGEQPLHRAVHSGESVSGLEAQLQRPDGSRIDVMLSATPLNNTHGPRGGILAIVDLTERKVAEAHQLVLLYELQHRVKNIITTISSLASRMIRGTDSLKVFSVAFLGRLRAMAVTHDLLSRTNWTGANLRTLAETALGGLVTRDGADIDIRGPNLTLTPNAATNLGLVFYELGTNAAKYGSLSNSGGRVDVTWQFVDASGKVRLIWTELDGPAILGPLTEGFGAAFVKRSVEFELQGSAAVEPRPTGVRWTLEFPAKGNVQGA